MGTSSLSVSFFGGGGRGIPRTTSHPTRGEKERRHPLLSDFPSHILPTMFYKNLHTGQSVNAEGRREGLLTNIYSEGIHPKVQLLILLYTIIDRKGTPLMYLP